MCHDNQPFVLLLGPIAHGEISLPIAATRICAGFPSPADDFLYGEIDLTRILTPNRAATFFLLEEMHATTLISVSHRPSLDDFHGRRLTMLRSSDGAVRVSKAYDAASILNGASP